MTWLLEPNCGDKLTVSSSGALLTTEGVRRRSPVNALWKGSPLSSRNPVAQSYTIHISRMSIDQAQKGSIWVGFCPENKFAAGWMLRGFSFGGSAGNLSDGGGLKRSNFGQALTGGHTVNLRGEVAPNGNLHIYIAVDGQGYGLAFDVSGAALLGDMFPFVSFTDVKEDVPPIHVSIQKDQVTKPLADFLSQHDHSLARNSIAGHWNSSKLGSFSIGLTKILSVKIANTISIQLLMHPPHSANGQTLSTRMMSPPHLQEVEKRIGELLQNIKRVSINEDGRLVISFTDSTSIQADPVEEEQQTPVSREEINWI